MYMPNWDFDDQNDSLSHFVVGDTEDDIILNRRIAENKGFDEGLKLSNYVPGNDNVKRVSVSVVAVKGERRSPFQFTSINGLLSRIPVRTASFTEIEAAKDLWDKPVDEFKSQLVAYLSMADGTVKRVAKNSTSTMWSRRPTNRRRSIFPSRSTMRCSKAISRRP